MFDLTNAVTRVKQHSYSSRGDQVYSLRPAYDSGVIEKAFLFPLIRKYPSILVLSTDEYGLMLFAHVILPVATDIGVSSQQSKQWDGV